MINGLAMIILNADINTRLMVANGIVMAKVCYMIQLWGVSAKNLADPAE